MARLAALMLRNPLKSLYFSYSFLVQIFIILLRRLLLPHFPIYQSVRLQIQRAYLASAAVNFPDLVHRLPILSCPEQRARKIGSGWTGYIIPGRKSLSDFTGESQNSKRSVALYAHGGGYARGEARMYMNYMERWVMGATQAGLDLVFLSVEYRKDCQCGRVVKMDC
jgi:acetyl esterase/lipase